MTSNNTEHRPSPRVADVLAIRVLDLLVHGSWMGAGKEVSIVLGLRPFEEHLSPSSTVNYPSHPSETLLPPTASPVEPKDRSGNEKRQCYRTLTCFISLLWPCQCAWRECPDLALQERQSTLDLVCHRVG